MFWYFNNVFVFHTQINYTMVAIYHFYWHNYESESKYLLRFNVVQICNKLYVIVRNKKELDTTPMAL